MTKRSSSPVLKNVGIVYRTKNGGAKRETTKLVSWLQERGIKVYLANDKLKLAKTKVFNNKNLNHLDLMIVLGGDGTYLYATSIIQDKNVPLLGINWGSLGFLTETSADHMYEVLELALLGKLNYQNRSLLKVVVKKQGKKATNYLALNDIVFERGPFSRLIRFLLYSNGQFVTDSRADGIIVSTPTGSTAYNLAAGGPIMHPETKAMIFTPICPHSLTQRPLVLPENHKVCIKIEAPTQKAHFMIDGQKTETLSPNDEIHIEVAKVKHTLVSHPETNYFDLLRKKLQYGTRV